MCVFRTFYHKDLDVTVVFLTVLALNVVRPQKDFEKGTSLSLCKSLPSPDLGQYDRMNLDFCYCSFRHSSIVISAK